MRDDSPTDSYTPHDFSVFLVPLSSNVFKCQGITSVCRDYIKISRLIVITSSVNVAQKKVLLCTNV